MATGPPPSIVRYPCVRTQVPRRSPPRNGGCDRPYIGSGRERVSGHEEAVAASLADDEACRLEGPQRSGDRLTCRADRLAEELVRKRQLDADPPSTTAPCDRASCWSFARRRSACETFANWARLSSGWRSSASSA